MTVAVTGMLAVLAANQNSPREFTTGVIGYIVVVVLLVVSIIYKLSMEALTRKTLFVNLCKIGYTRKELRKIVRQEVISYYFVLILIPLVYIMFISGRFIYYGDMSLKFAYIYILSYITQTTSYSTLCEEKKYLLLIKLLRYMNRDKNVI